MPKIEIYTSAWCPYCVRAKQLLDRKGVTYDEIDIMANPRRRPEMVERAGGRTSVPQIFIDDVGIGGCDDMHALDREGRLNPMLGIPA